MAVTRLSSGPETLLVKATLRGPTPPITFSKRFALTR